MGSDSIRPETRSRFVSGARRPYRRRSALKNSQWKSMWVTCSVMSHRSLFILSAITHAFYNPWAIEFLYTWRSTPMEDICIFRDTHVQLHQIVTRTHTHRQTKSLAAGLRQSKHWHVVTDTGREMYTAPTQRETHCMKYLSTGSEWNGERREVLTVARSPEKWSRRWRKWIKVIGCDKEEVKKEKGDIIQASPRELWQYERFATHMGS